MERIYNALISGAPGAYFSVCFPDFPGCVTGGDTLSDALANARTALELHIEGMAEDGEAIPEESSDQALAELLEQAPGENPRIALVPCDVPDGERERINISLPKFLVARIDKFAAECNRSRSAFLADAAQKYMRG